MNDNKTLIIRKFEELKGQFVINGCWEIQRLVAVGEDDMDYYWITYDGRKFKWNTCVGPIMPLKGYLRTQDYNEFVRLAYLNHYDLIYSWANSNLAEAEQHSRDHKNELLKLPENHRFLTDVCWELTKIES